MKSLLVLILSLSFIGCANYKSLDDVYFNQEADQIVSNQENLQLFTGKLKIKIDDEKFVLDIKDGVNFTENMTLNLSQVEESCEDGNGPLLIKGTGLPFTGDLIIINEGIDTFLKLYNFQNYLPIPIITQYDESLTIINDEKYQFLDYLNVPYFKYHQKKVKEAIYREEILYREFKASQRFEELERELNMNGGCIFEDNLAEEHESNQILVRPYSNDIVKDKYKNMRENNPLLFVELILIEADLKLVFEDFEKLIISYENGILTGEMQHFNFNRLVKEIELMPLADVLVNTERFSSDYKIENIQSNRVVKKEYWSNGNIKSIQSYKFNEDTLDGPFLVYNKDGILIAEGSFLDNKLIRDAKTYDDLGNFEEVAFYEDGRKSSSNCYYPNGQIRETITYKDSSYARTESKYYSNGQLLYSLIYDTEDNLSNKEFKVYYGNGNLKLSMQENNGLIDGLVEEYYATGQIKSTTNYKDGLVAGKWSFWKKDGSILDEGDIENGTGLYTYYDFENGMVYEIPYKDLKPTGKFIKNLDNNLVEYEINDGEICAELYNNREVYLTKEIEADENLYRIYSMHIFNDTFPFKGSFTKMVNFYRDEIITPDWKKDSDETSY